MSYKPQMKTLSSIRGNAEFQLSNKNPNVAQFIINYRDGKDEKSLKMRVAISDLPDSLQKGLKVGQKTYRMCLSADGKKIFSAYPLSGIFNCKFGGIPHDEKEPPTYRTGVGKFGEYHTFMILHEIVDGPFAGEKIPQFMSYNFEGFTNDAGKREAGYSKNMEKSPPTKELDRVMNVLGIWNKAIAWKDQEDGSLYNILPVFEARGLEQAKTVRYQVVLEDGNVSNIVASQASLFAEVSADDDLDDDFDDDDFDTDDEDDDEALAPDVVVDDDEDEIPFDADDDLE